ncbi:Rab-GTPase-TBC_domain-containing protein [Hexamita inflata]|uniref:Rab-GTPase-TBC domain-containing protein n=1 Tax=Hexamita inflata TaxID=28002 RepID=A0AA86RBI7_9EUKA|nr:Rab-GTPase-TBC domain-containing protein [Hexamita inflata]
MDYDNIMDEECQNALKERLLLLREIKPEILSAEGDIDEYGFFKNMDKDTECLKEVFPQFLPQEGSVETNPELEQQWQNILIGPSPIKMIKKDNKDMLKELTRKGIPNHYRALAWQLLNNSIVLYEENEVKNQQQNTQTTYCKFLTQKIPERAIIQINKDIDRTQPRLQFYRSEDHLSQLFRMLKAYAAYDPDVEYCQGMAFPASILLYYMPEAEAYWSFSQLMRRCSSLYADDLRGVMQRQKVFRILLKEAEPEIYNHLEFIRLTPDIYSTGWFMSLFLNQFRFNVSLRILEQFFCEDKTLYRAGIAILKFASNFQRLKLKYKTATDLEYEFDKCSKPKGGISLLDMPMGVAMIFIQNIGHYVYDADEFIKIMLSVKFSTKRMKQIEKEIGGV